MNNTNEFTSRKRNTSNSVGNGRKSNHRKFVDSHMRRNRSSFLGLTFGIGLSGHVTALNHRLLWLEVVHHASDCDTSGN